MRLIFDIEDGPTAFTAALTAWNNIGCPKDWKIGYGWAVSVSALDFWIKRTKTGYSVKQLSQTNTQ